MNKKCFLNFIGMAILFCFMFASVALFANTLKDLTIVMNSHESKPFFAWFQYIGMAMFFSSIWTLMWLFFKKSEKICLDCIK